MEQAERALLRSDGKMTATGLTGSGAEPRPHRLEILLIVAGWTVFGLFYANQTYITATGRGSPISAGRALALGMSDAFFWALATVAIFWLARRFPLARGRLLRHAAAHLIAGVTLSLARIGVIVALSQWTELYRPVGFTTLFYRQFHAFLLLYVLLLGIAWAVYYHGRYREREQAAEQLAAGLAEARFQALKMQLHPHFLFNTLNAISALIPQEAQPARRMVARLGDLLRAALEQEATQEVSLREELEFLEPYLEIEQTRLGDRLSVEFQLEPETLDARVPHLVLQPLVENAIRHGIAPRSGPGVVTIAAAVEGGSLILEIRNTGGATRAGSAHEAGGRGLANVRSRLEHLYGADQQLTAGPARPDGWVTTVRIPFHASGPVGAVPLRAP
jgi:two-component system, LytTR family, sensor kinase